MNVYDIEISNKIEHIVKRHVDNITDRDILDIMELSFEEANISSITFIKLIIDIEQEFGFEFEDEYLNYSNMNGFKKMVSIIAEHIIPDYEA